MRNAIWNPINVRGRRDSPPQIEAAVSCATSSAISRRPWSFALKTAAPAVAAALFGVSGGYAAEPSPATAAAAAAGESAATEPYNTGWELYIDNDAIVSLDRDYTGGIALSLSGRRVTEYRFLLHPVLKALDRRLGIESLYTGKPAQRRHNMEFGLASFTPADVTIPEPIPDDHPYACLLFVNNAEQVLLPQENVAYQTTFLLGLLGTNVCASLQKGLHRLIGADRPRGWDNRISEGGEPTARWGITRHALLYEGNTLETPRSEVKWTLEGGVGYTTDVGMGINWRWGWIASPWWSFAPHQAEYINTGTPVAQSRKTRRRELFVWAGGTVRYRLYNAILEGQFRDSEVEFARSDLHPLVGETWAGITREFQEGLRVSLVVRVRSQEIRDVDNPSPVWGGLILG